MFTPMKGKLTRENYNSGSIEFHISVPNAIKVVLIIRNEWIFLEKKNNTSEWQGTYNFPSGGKLENLDNKLGVYANFSAKDQNYSQLLEYEVLFA